MEVASRVLSCRQNQELVLDAVNMAIGQGLSYSKFCKRLSLNTSTPESVPIIRWSCELVRSRYRFRMSHPSNRQRRSWTDRSASHGGLHSRSDSFKSATAAPLQPLRDDYRSTTRRQDDYSSGGRDYGLRDREPRRPGSPYYDYNRAAPAVTHGYDDRRYPPAPTRPAYPPERPPSPYGVSPRATGTLPPSRDYVRGYDRSPASYDTRAIPPHVSPYADSSSYTRRSDAYPSTMQNMHGNQPYPGYPSTR